MLRRLTNKQFNEIKLLYILTGMVFLVAFGLMAWFGWNFFENKLIETAENYDEQPTSGISAQDCQYRRVLDGVCVRDESEVNPKLVAIMVDNHPDARPLSGLAEASIVYEAQVEGDYTRFMAIYPAGVEVKEVGPVRSARPYYLDWLSEYGDAMYMHVGGSPEALSLIKEYGIFDLNEFYRGWYYWRDRNRVAPHYIYTSSEWWQKALADYADESSVVEYGGWAFNTSPLHHIITSSLGESDLAANVRITFLAPDYVAEWKFNISTKKYERYQGGELQRDTSGKKIKADTVIIQHVKSRVIDEIGRKRIDTIGAGDVTVFYDGRVILGTWKKEKRTGRTRFYDAIGEEVKLKPGKVWIEIIGEDGDIEIGK